MFRFALVAAFALSFQAHAIPSGMFCQTQLLARSGLGIGAIVRSQRKIYLGLAPYAGALHSNLITVMNNKHAIDSILWMGEVRYTIEKGIPKLLEANETSGYYYELSQQVDPKVGKRSVQVFNTLFNIPRSLRAETFKAFPFDPGNLRLVPELNGLKSVRHDITAALQTIMTFTALMQIPNYNDDDRAKIYGDLMAKYSNDLVLAKWYVHHLVESHRVSSDGTRHVSLLLEYLEKGQWQKVRREADQGVLEKELSALSSQANILADKMPYEIFEIR